MTSLTRLEINGPFGRNAIFTDAPLFSLGEKITGVSQASCNAARGIDIRLKRAVTVSVVVVAMLGVGEVGMAQKPVPPAVRARVPGKQLFATRCAGCHGLDGHGSERGPNIAINPNLLRMADEKLGRVISNGIPNRGMPAFRLIGQSRINEIVAFVRTLQGNATSASFRGDPQRGKSLFFGKAACADCHMISGQGGFLASDLSSYGQSRSASEIRNDIVEPLPSGSAGRSVSATTKDGQTVSGVVRNEDNFSIQIIDTKGKFHMLSKNDVTDLKHLDVPTMPTDYGQKLSPEELDDLVHFLHNASAVSKVQAHTTEEE